MKKITQIARVTMLALTFLACSIMMSFATPYGTYIGSDGNNDSESVVNALINTYNLSNDPDLPSPVFELAKYEVDEGVWEDGESGGFTLTGENGNSGTWQSSLHTTFYYSIKAGSGQSGAGFDLYYVDGITLGTGYDWDTSGLANKDLSHLTFWAPQSTPVPEPATMLLFGSGLVGLAGYARRRMK